MANEKIRKPSKVIKEELYSPFFVRYIVHGKAIKYDSIEKTSNKKGVPMLPSASGVEYLGFIDYRDVERYMEDDMTYVSVFAKNFLKENHALATSIYHDIRRIQRANIMNVVPDLFQGATISVLIYRYKI